MLVLTRKVGEQILIGDEVVVSIVAIEGGRVRLGVKAPMHVRILRQELADRMHESDALELQGAGR